MPVIKFSEQKGKFVKHCPCTPGVVSCGYYNINLHTGCPFDCSYCILQVYLENPNPVFFTNINKLEEELVELSTTTKYLRIGTGELSDSLALDHETNYSSKILAIFERFPEVIFEFKTKSNQVTNLLNYPKKLKNIVISWSLNPQEVIAREEKRTPDLESRLIAMKQVQDAGYKVGIHFDPLLLFKGWQESYKVLIAEIAQKINPASIAWWSLGALRFPYDLRKYIFKHKDSRLFEGELVKGFDDKYRYFKPLRLELFLHIRDLIYSMVSNEAPLYLCMEDDEVWREVLPNLQPCEEEVNRYLYQVALR